MRKILLVFFLTIFLGIAVSFVPMSSADDNSCSSTNCTGGPDYCIGFYNQCLATLQKALSDSENATHPLQSQLKALQNQVENIKNQVAQIEVSLSQKQKIIDDSFKNIAQKQILLNATIRDFYIKSSYNSPLLILLSAPSANELTQILGYQKAVEDQDKLIITNLAITISNLQTQKQQLQSEETSLTALKSNLDTQSAKLNEVIQGALAYQSNLNTQIAALTGAQQQLLAQKYASLNIPLFAYSTQGGCSSDINPYKDPGFSGTKFGFFTYGVPNRVGLNQYGAFGRARAGQSYTQILQAYYNYDSLDNRNATINVDGNGSYSLEDYVKRVYEVPNNWGDQGGMEALKAQAVAVRSYALAYTNNGSGSICTTQDCQVFQPNDKGGNWDAAVDATAGQVMVQGGQPIKAWFSSTHGGYVHSSSDIGWSATSFTKSGQDSSSQINNFSDLNNNAYDKDSPWFYCDWGSRTSYNNTAWMQSSDVADIANVILLAQADTSTQSHLVQTDKSNPDGTDTWDAPRVQQELKNRGISPFTSVSSVSVSADFGSGTTTTVTVNGDAGSQNFSGSTFKSYFNLRAPANIQIVGPLYNIETK